MQRKETQIISAGTHLKNFFVALSPLKKWLLVGAILFALALIFTLGGSIGDKIRQARYNKKEAARMKQVQTSLAAAEAAEKRAEAKEAQAAQLETQNEAKAGSLKTADASINQETKQNEQQITSDYQAKLARIDSDLSLCQRCKDVCSELDNAARANPDFGQYRCDADACSEDCSAGDSR